MPNTQTDSNTYSVSSLNRAVKELLEFEFTQIWVEGEISNLSQPKSGHLYFSLKDENAQIRCAMFRGNQKSLSFSPEDGLKVTAKARVSLYAPRGDYQLIAESLELAGEGALSKAFDALKLKLLKEGLFDKDNKQPIPAFPSTIGIVTSPTGAAIRDILHVLERRFPAINIKIFASSVQGATATQELINALGAANADPEIELVIIGRGGGSLEDLWCFNEERLARAIFSCNTPIISAVGHETDFCISDFVADLRAPTPSAAAEIASPEQTEVLQTFKSYELQITSLLTQQIKMNQSKLDLLRKTLKHPKQKLEELNQKLDYLESKLIASNQEQLKWHKLNLQHLNQRLDRYDLHLRIRQEQDSLTHLREKLLQAIDQKLTASQQSMKQATLQLNVLNPLNTLNRGYSFSEVIIDGKKPKLLRSVKEAKPNDTIRTFLADGSLRSSVSEIKHHEINEYVNSSPALPLET